MSEPTIPPQVQAVVDELALEPDPGPVPVPTLVQALEACFTLAPLREEANRWLEESGRTERVKDDLDDVLVARLLCHYDQFRAKMPVRLLREFDEAMNSARSLLELPPASQFGNTLKDQLRNIEVNF